MTKIVFKFCVTTGKGHDAKRPLLSSKENNKIVVWHEIRKNRTIFFNFMLITVKREMGTLTTVIRYEV